MTLNANVMLHK